VKLAVTMDLSGATAIEVEGADDAGETQEAGETEPVEAAAE
jgi:hypothetical protein